MSKRKLTIGLALVALAVGALVAIQALAADLHGPHVGSYCDGPGDWHFVNTQTRGADAGTLTVTFADAGTLVVGPSQVNHNNQHFDISGPSGPVTAASTNLPGRLVLSDLDCGPDCVPSSSKELNCSDGIDDDCDGYIDCDDVDCDGNPACDDPCVPTGPEVCTGGIDEDCDGDIDCDDYADCKNDPACAPS